MKKFNTECIREVSVNEQLNCGKLAFWQDWFPEFRKGMCEGRAIWIQSPQKGFCIQHAKSVLGTLGFSEVEMPYLSASEFLFCSRFGFLYHMTIRSRALLIGGMYELSNDELAEFAKILKKSREFKHAYELNLVMIDEWDARIEKLLGEVHVEIVQPVLIEENEMELNEVVQGWLEEASNRFQKKVYRLSEGAAEYLEELSMSEGLDSVKFHIFQGVAKMYGQILELDHLVSGKKKDRFSLAGIGAKFEKNEIF